MNYQMAVFENRPFSHPLIRRAGLPTRDFGKTETEGDAKHCQRLLWGSLSDSGCSRVFAILKDLSRENG